jgi:hypothetical protein
MVTSWSASTSALLKYKTSEVVRAQMKILPFMSTPSILLMTITEEFMLT